MASAASLTERLQLFMQGDVNSADALVREIWPKLREIALRSLQKERFHVPLCPTELINEFWASSLAGGGWRIQDRSHFYRLAARMMRNTLVDLARRRLTERRGGDQTTISLDEVPAGAAGDTSARGPSIDDASRIVEIGILMDRLEVESPDGACIVDMHYFAGFTLEEIAQQTGLTLKQVRGRWDKAHKWLERQLRPSKPS